MYDKTKEQVNIGKDSLPILICAKDSVRLGISKGTFYRITHMEGSPVVIIGRRRYLHRDKFFCWLDQAVNIPT